MESIPISIPSNLWYIARPDLPNKVDFFALNIAVDSSRLYLINCL